MKYWLRDFIELYLDLTILKSGVPACPLSTGSNQAIIMRYIGRVTRLTAIFLLLTACSSTPYKNPAERYPSPGRLDNSNTTATKEKLITQHREWHGTPYRYGGMSKRGIDCSGFVYLTYRNKFGIELPRSTEQQSEAGTEISQRQLSAGDLVFFRTGFSKQHVGIYMSNRKFLHVSTSRGVMISSMDNVYWRDKYWKAQRI